MSSVMDMTACQICGGVEWSDFDIRTQSGVEACTKCGTVRKISACTDESGKFIRNEKGFLQFKEERTVGFGSAVLVQQGHDVRESFTFKSADDVLSFKNDMIAQVEAGTLVLDLDQSHIYAFNPETATGEVIYGNSQPEEA